MNGLCTPSVCWIHLDLTWGFGEHFIILRRFESLRQVMENGEEPSAKKIKTEPIGDESGVPTSNSHSGQAKLLIDPMRVQHLQEIAKQFDSRFSKKATLGLGEEGSKETDGISGAKNSKTGKVSSQRLNNIIDRLSSEGATDGKGSLSTDNANSITGEGKENSVIGMAAKDAGTQTSVSMVQLIKSIIRDRMKALQDSVFKDAAVDNLMNGKLIELRKENKELKDCLEKLQTKYDSLVSKYNRLSQPQNQSSATHSDKALILDGVKAVEGTTATAVINPYQVQATTVQSGGFIVLQNNSRVTSLSTKPTITRTMSGVRAIAPAHPPVSMTHRQSNLHRGPPQQQQQQQQRMQMLVNVGQPINAQGPLVNVHGQPFNVQGQVVGGQPQVLTAQGPIVNAAGQLVNSKGQPVPPISPQMRPAPQSRYGPPPYAIPGTHANARPSASTQVVYASQGVRVTADPRMTAMPPNYEQATGTQGVHFSHSSVGPRPRMVQPPPNFVHQNSPGQRPIAPQQARPVDGISSVSSNANRPNLDSLPLPPRLQVTISAAGSGIVLSWDVESPVPANMPSIECYHLFAYQDSEFPPRSPASWKRIGVVKALPLPMACTLTQFVSGSSYHFAIMAVDMYGREGPMSNPCTIRLGK